MSTANRPTWNPAQGVPISHGIGSRHVSGKDQAGFTTLKFRQFGQNSKEELTQRDLKDELLRREQEYSNTKKNSLALIQNEEKQDNVLKLLENRPSATTVTKYNDTDADLGGAEIESDKDVESSRFDICKQIAD